MVVTPAGMKELGIRSQIEFAPYNQIFQQLLGPSSLLARNRGGLNVILLRVEDWQRSVESESAPRASGEYENLKGNAVEFVRALKALTSRNPSPCLICICPSAPAKGNGVPTSIPGIEK